MVLREEEVDLEEELDLDRKLAEEPGESISESLPLSLHEEDSLTSIVDVAGLLGRPLTDALQLDVFGESTLLPMLIVLMSIFIGCSL